jgi:hypothetical protein
VSEKYMKNPTKAKSSSEDFAVHKNCIEIYLIIFKFLKGSEPKDEGARSKGITKTPIM